MKVSILIISLFLFAWIGRGQDGAQANNLDVTVVDKKWRTDIRVPRLEVDPNKEANDRMLEDKQRIEIEALNETLRKQGMPPRRLPTRPLPRDEKPSGVSVTYKYEAKLANGGRKKVSGIVWEYVFLDPATMEELGRRRFKSDISIDPGKTKTIVERSVSPPTGTVDASTSGKPEKEQYLEQILIRKVFYQDGSVWSSGN